MSHVRSVGEGSEEEPRDPRLPSHDPAPRPERGRVGWTVPRRCAEGEIFIIWYLRSSFISLVVSFTVLSFRVRTGSRTRDRRSLSESGRQDLYFVGEERSTELL